MKESPFVMECKLHEIVYLGNKPASGNLILGKIVRFHISDKILDDSGKVDPILLDAVSRMGGSWYSKSNKGLFELKKPRWNGLGFDLIPTKILNSQIITANNLSKLASVEVRPSDVGKIYNLHKSNSIEKLEKLCKEFIEKDLLDYAWTIVSIIEEK